MVGEFALRGRTIFVSTSTMCSGSRRGTVRYPRPLLEAGGYPVTKSSRPLTRTVGLLGELPLVLGEPLNQGRDPLWRSAPEGQ